jgi:superfamily II DNA or RNA helicase
LSEFQSRLGLRISLIVWRHLIVAIFRQYLPSAQDPLLAKANKAKGKSPQNGSDSEFEFDSDEDIADRQAGRSLATSERVYARGLDELPGAKQSNRAKYRALSCWLHQFYRLKSAKAYWDNNKQQEREDWMQKRHKLQKINLLTVFQRYFGAQSTFRGQQEAGLDLIRRGYSPILIISGTGSGKSLYFQLLALISDPDSLTVIVVPLIALRQDLINRFHQLGIAATQWDYKKTAFNSRVLLITFESAISYRVLEYAQRQISQKRLDRIYIDECHLILDTSEQFRPKVQQIGKLLALPAQFIYLTATLPPENEQEWFRIAGIRREQTKILREQTTRVNIRYSVINIDHTQLWKTFTQLIQTRSATIHLPDQILVYCTTRLDTIQAGKLIGCPIFHAGIKESEKAVLLKRFTLGEIPILIATSAFGLGIHTPTIRLIVHLHTPRLLRSYSQESGRAGRDGQPAEAVLLRGSPDIYPDIDPNLIRYSTIRTCRRIVLDEVLDGRSDRSECEVNEEKCDLCSRSQAVPEAILEAVPEAILEAVPEAILEAVPEAILEAVPEAIPEAILETRPISPSNMVNIGEQEQQKTQLNYRQNTASSVLIPIELVLKLNRWSEHCPRCLVKREGCDCPRAEISKLAISRAEIRRRLNFARHSGCWECGVPQSICPRWSVIRNGGYQRREGVDCRWPRVLTEFLAYQLQTEDVSFWDWISTLAPRYSIVLNSQEQVLQLLGKKYGAGEIETNQLCRAFWILGPLTEE